MFFDSAVNSRWLIKTECLVLFTKQNKLAAKMRRSSLGDCFPDFVSSDLPDLKSATDYFVDRFVSLNNHKNKVIHTRVLPDLPTKEDCEAIKAMAWEIQGRKQNIQQSVGFVRNHQPHVPKETS